MKTRFMCELAAAIADFIAEDPKGAALVARSFSQLLAREAAHEDEEREQERERQSRRGYGRGDF